MAALLLVSAAAQASAPPARAAGSHDGERAQSPSMARPSAERLACSRSVCIHASKAANWQHTQTPAVVQLLQQAQDAHDSLTALGLWPPLHDAERGGDGRLDLYLEPEWKGARAHTDDRRHWLGPDRISTFIRLGLGGAASACAIPSHIARSVAQAFILSFDPAVHDGTLSMHSSYLATLLAPCPSLELPAMDAFQRHPEQALNAAHPSSLSGNLLFPAFLDTYYGPGSPGATMHVLLSLASQSSSPDRLDWHNEPDLYDAARRLLKPLDRNLGDLLLDFAIARAFVGNRCDGAHIEDVDRYGSMGRVRFDWSLGLESLPRRLGPLTPPAPTGASYLWLDTRNASAKDRLTVAIEWEESHVFNWALVKIDAQGRERSRHRGGGVWGQSKLRLSLSKVDDAAAVLIVGSHTGNDDRSRPYDPDLGASRRASYEITLYNQ